MANLGERGNVMGPQPIAPRTQVPPAMIAAAERVLKLLADGDHAGLAAMATAAGAREIAEIAAAVKPGVYTSHEIIATARVNSHHYVKARLSGVNADPFTMQVRLGEHEGCWVIWDAMNLTGRRGAWTR
jgi:hypothetical protein